MTDCVEYNASNASNGAHLASLTIRKLDERTKRRLRVRAARHGRSMEEEARTLLRTALAEEAPISSNLADDIRARFGPLGGVELRLPPRQPMRRPPKPQR